MAAGERRGRGRSQVRDQRLTCAFSSQLYKANATHRETLVTMSGMNEMVPTLVHTAALKMRFVTDSNVGYTGTNTGWFDDDDDDSNSV